MTTIRGGLIQMALNATRPVTLRQFEISHERPSICCRRPVGVVRHGFETPGCACSGGQG